ncbi:MAG TPA: glycoside hydrolase family 2 TIM barrel-domain containing protein [Polyangia bacterium]|nr:glycoside hydrolase family 2 TIM barrel-domain containing protein [Polyangia bacterium]
MLRAALPLALYLAVATPALAAPRPSVNLAGDWKYQPYEGGGDLDLAAPTLDDAGWPTMSLPTSWFLMGSKAYPAKARARARLMDAGSPADLPAPPKDVGFDYAGTVWFRKTIQWDGGIAAGTPVIDLDMVDYYAEVFVNGQSLGKHEGYFQKWSVDASRALKKGKNVIALKVSAPPLAFDLAQQFPVSWPKQQNQVKGIFGYHDTRPGATSPRGQERGTGGVLRGVGLRVSSGVDLVELKVTPMDVSAASARLVIEAVTRNWGGKPVAATLTGTIRPKNFAATPTVRLPVSFEVRAAPGVSRSVGEVKIDKPALWWSWDYGKPNLYSLDAELKTSGKVPADLDAKTVAFGVRSIARDDNWVVRLNGQRIYARGSNYIATQWLSQADRAFYERDLKLVVGANLNSLRVHAHLERPEFYDAADELGVMIWQDFPLQWGYTDEPAFHAEAARQAADMIDRYYDHPSILVWCMHNESPHSMSWMKKRDQNQNLALDEKLYEVAKKADPSRIPHRDSGAGDGHSYTGWYVFQIGDLVKDLPKERYITEFGAEALPALETLQTMFDADTLWPDTPLDWEAWKFADFQPDQTFDLAKVKMGKTIQEFIASSQRYQANLIRFQTEVFRRAKWTKTTGLYQFMFVDDWPSITWSVVDYDRRPKLGYASLRDSMQRLLPSIEYDIHKATGPIALWVVNDHLQGVPKATVKWKLTDPKGGGKPTVQSRTVDIPADAVIKVTDLGSIPRIGAGTARLDVWIEDEHGTFLARSSLTGDDYVIR